MGFGEAIQTGFSKYVNFSDRAIRSEYWFWGLFVFICACVTQVIDLLIGFPITYLIFVLATLVPNFAVSVRRLHDLDRTGWWLLLFLIPLIGAIILLVWFCMRGTVGANRFGDDPLVGVA